jgi:putative nucleotidyltransferase with HDIG domain
MLVLIVSYLTAIMMPDKEVKGHKVDAFTAIWPYKDLVLENDLLIEKAKDELNQEKKELKDNSPLFFELNNNEKELHYQKLENLKKSQANLYTLLKSKLDEIYTRGIIESNDSVVNKPIFLSKGDFAESAVYYDFYTLQTATNELENALKTNYPNFNYLDYLAINYYFDKRKTDLFLQTKLQQISIYKNVLKAGEVLAKRGEALTNEKRNLINTYFYLENSEQTFSLGRFIAKWGLSFIICLVLLAFLAFFRASIFGQNKQVAFLYLLLLASVTCTFIFYKFGLMIFALPFALVPILVRVFFDSRAALFTHLMVVLFCSFFMPDKIEFILLELLTGIGTLFAVAEMRKRQQILNAAFLVFVFYVIIFITYQIGYATPQAILKITSYVPFFVSSMLVLLVYPLIFLTERFFGFISDFKLLELCDLNHPLLRKLSKEVPGTFQHSLQVANLAEEAIFYIGGNSLLIRAGAMYHDIGKIKNPNFFTENQANGFSPHQEMNPLDSAKIIINHVILGIEMAKEYKIPEQIIDFIRTHHGTTSVRYFYSLFQKLEGHEAAKSEEQFHYPGPIPFSKETAVLMIADGVEAASRSLKVHDATTISDLVDQMIDYKIKHNQFINADITFKDITVIKKIFKKRLMNIYHARIEYPD